MKLGYIFSVALVGAQSAYWNHKLNKSVYMAQEDARAHILADINDNIAPCPGDTRGDRRCNKDNTHRVCALIGLPGSTFF